MEWFFFKFFSLHPIVNRYRFNTTVSSAWTVSSPLFARPDSDDAQCHYDTFDVTVLSTGSYIFKCDSSMDSYGYLYCSNFSAAYSSFNIISYDDENGGRSQFQITADLQPDVTYVLVATTFSGGDTGSHAITVSGFMSVNLVRANYMTVTPMRTTTTGK